MNANDAMCQPISKNPLAVHLACANTVTLRCLFASCIPNEEALNDDCNVFGLSSSLLSVNAGKHSQTAHVPNKP